MATGQVRTESELLEIFKDNVNKEIQPVDLRDLIVTTFAGILAVTGVSSYVYIAYADDASGAGFTTSFDPTKNFIAIRTTDTEIVAPSLGDFVGLWKSVVGADGTDGTMVRYGSIDPTAIVGNEGDFYINNTTNTLFGPKTGAVWGSGVSLVGNGVASVVLTGTVGAVDTYRMTFDDATFFDYTVTNGTGIQSGVNTGAVGAGVFKSLDISNNLQFRKVISASTNITVTENTDDITLNYTHDLAPNSLTLTIPDFVNNAQLFEMYGTRLYKYFGNLVYSGPGVILGSGTVIGNVGYSVMADSSFVVGLFDSANKFKESIGVRLTPPNVLVFESVGIAISPGDYISLENIVHFRI